MYPTDLTDSQWDQLKEYLNVQRKRKYDLREVVNALIYILRTGYQWRMLPQDFPPYRSVFYYYQKWRDSGLLAQLSRLLLQKVRQQRAQRQEPSLAIVDAQSVKNSEWGVQEKGYDGFKKVKGRKRHLAVDKNGAVLAAVVLPANRNDSKAGTPLLKEVGIPAEAGVGG